MSDISRRSFMRNAAIGAATVGTLGLLAGCAPKQEEPAPQANADAPADGATANVLDPQTMPDAATASNFNVVEESATTVGTTLDNLKTAIEGETGATTKYAAWAKVAEKAGYDHIARLFNCTSDAEKIHIELEYKLAQKLEPGYEKPEPPEVPEHTVDLNLIAGTNGEIYETSDMYPAFIKVAQEEQNNEAVQVFTRAKLAEAYHAERYLDAYNTIDTPTDDKYYLCPICGYIHKGENFTACPICLAPKASFKEY
ncbi:MULTISPECIES: nigerythrin [Gordonibacter]|uniref:nigerythrin n=1 Tax=Gordonibacter TaxID=644652 RepID=UPI000F4CDAA7|nr:MULTISPECIES: rubrerythrin family protein [Gordonibacter]MDN4469031.1 rubrerythrin family protein [Gordonibacter sp. RACS_AR68]ROT92925.1 rubrerythrin [Gordonibacter urolithinfaciens]GKG89059.1 nigerythrin [Gordonibacter pamelaeae]